MKFNFGGVEIDHVGCFCYLGRILDQDDDDTHALLCQLDRAQVQWGCIGSVLCHEGVKPRMMGGPESWVF